MESVAATFYFICDRAFMDMTATITALIPEIIINPQQRYEERDGWGNVKVHSLTWMAPDT